MKLFTILTVVILFTICAGIPNYLGTDLQSCLNCLCHARTGCFSRFNCANYSISFEYWQTARSPVVDVNDEPDDEESYMKCIRNENCILATLTQYAEAIGHIDCNCDDKFDCKDRLAIHLKGSDCVNPEFSKLFADRFNRCAKNLNVSKMMPEEGFEGCVPEIF